MRYSCQEFQEFSRRAFTQCERARNSCQESCIFLKPLVRILARLIPRAPRICTISQELVKNFRKTTNCFDRKTPKSTNNLSGKPRSQEIQERPRIVSRILGKPNQRWKESRGLKIPVQFTIDPHAEIPNRKSKPLSRFMRC